MKQWLVGVSALAIGVVAASVPHGTSLSAQQGTVVPAYAQSGVAASPQAAPAPVTVPEIPFDSSTDFLKYSPDMNFGEVLGVAINSKNHLVVLNHPGSPTQGPLYGNASTQLLEFDLATGRFVREIGKNVYGMGYGHAIRFDRADNLWVVDKGTNAAVRFNPAGYVTMNLGRRPEGPDDPEESWFRNGRGSTPPPPTQDGYFLMLISPRTELSKARMAPRATLVACSPTCMTQPMITSSTRAGSAPVRSSRLSRTWPARSAGCQPDSLPPLRPPAVRVAATI